MAGLTLLAGIAFYAMSAACWLCGLAFVGTAVHCGEVNETLVFGGRWSRKKQALFAAGSTLFGFVTFVAGFVCLPF